MGSILSPEQSINNIRLVDATSKPRKVQSVVSQGDNIFIRVNEYTLIVATKKNTEKWAFPPSIDNLGFRWIGDALKAMHKLKMISQKPIDAHTAFCKERDEARTLKYSLESVQRIAKEHDLTIPKSWLTKLKAEDKSNDPQ